MIVPGRKWRPLHVAIAWIVARDEQFCSEIETDPSAKETTFVAPDRLEHAMLASGCFLPEPQALVCFRTIDEEITTHSTWAVKSTLCWVRELGRWEARPNYVDRFATLALEYEETAGYKTSITGRCGFNDELLGFGIVSLGQYLFDRWIDSFDLLVARIGDEEVNARGTALIGNERTPLAFPPEAVTDAMWLDLEGNICEGPQKLRHEQPRRWTDVTVNWAELQSAFPDYPSAEPESQCRYAAASDGAKPGQSSGPVSKIPLIQKINRELFPKGPPEGMGVKIQREKISKVLKTKHSTTASESTFYRAGIGKTSR